MSDNLPVKLRDNLPVKLLRTDGGTMARVTLDQGTIESYSELMRAGEKFPPVVVFLDKLDKEDVHWLADGFHRLFAAKKAGIDMIDCEVRFGSREDAVWYGCAANSKHGLRRTNADKQLAVDRALLHPNSSGLSDREIATYVGVTHPMVAERRRRLELTGNLYQSPFRTGGDGRTINTAAIGKRAPDSAPRFHPDLGFKRTPQENAVRENLILGMESMKTIADNFMVLEIETLRMALTPNEAAELARVADWVMLGVTCVKNELLNTDPGRRGTVRFPWKNKTEPATCSASAEPTVAGLLAPVDRYAHQLAAIRATEEAATQIECGLTP